MNSDNVGADWHFHEAKPQRRNTLRNNAIYVLTSNFLRLDHRWLRRFQALQAAQLVIHLLLHCLNYHKVLCHVAVSLRKQSTKKYTHSADLNKTESYRAELVTPSTNLRADVTSSGRYHTSVFAINFPHKPPLWLLPLVHSNLHVMVLPGCFPLFFWMNQG